MRFKYLAVGLLLIMVTTLLNPSSPVQADGNGALGQSYNVTLNGDYVVASIALRTDPYNNPQSGGTLTVSGIPTGATIRDAFLYWASLGYSADNDVNFNGTPITGTTVGTEGDSCWGVDSSFGHRANVTALVTGNGSYPVSGFPADLIDVFEPEPPPWNQTAGVALVVIYEMPSLPQRTIIIKDGAMVWAGGNRNTIFSGYNVAMPITDARTTYMVADGQNANSYSFNGTPLPGGPSGDETDFWDVDTFNVTALTPNTSVVSQVNGPIDCLWWIGAVFSVTTNHAPVLDNSGTVTLPAQAEDTSPSTSIGSLIALIGGTGITDTSGAVEGIAVTAVDNTNGTWEYSTNAGGTWTAFGSPSVSNARLLADNPNIQIRFVPALNFVGNVTNSLTFRAWDQTAGSNGSSIDVTTSGGATAFSTAQETASLTVTEVNDPPFRSAGVISDLIANESDPLTPLGLAGISYGPGGGTDENAQTLTYQVTAVPTSALGQVFLADGVTAVAAGNAYSLADIQGMQFLPAPNASGGPEAFTFTVTDNGTTNGNPDPLTLTETLNISVGAVNNAPTLVSPPTATTLLDTPLSFSTLIQVADVDAGSGALAIQLNVSGGTLRLVNTAGLLTLTGNDSSSITASGDLASLSAALDSLIFTPTSGQAGSVTLTISVDDQGNTGAGGVQTATATTLITISSLPLTATPPLLATPIPASEATLPQQVFEDTDFITKSADRTLATIGDNITYTLTVTNPKGNTLRQVVITDQFDARFDNVRISAISSGIPVISGNTIIVQGLELLPGERLSITLQATISPRARPGDVIPNVASLESPDASIHFSNNVSVTILPATLPATGQSIWTWGRWLFLTVGLVGMALFLKR